MREKVILTVFTDPMMGLSWECEPLFRKLETHFAGQIEFRTVMALLVRDVHDFMTPSELALEPEEGMRRYNARLAQIYKSEESISGMPIHMEGFRLFDSQHITSLPLNLAYKAVQLTAPEKAERFLYRLRYATVVDCLPTTRLEEILKVVEATGLDWENFLRNYNDGTAEAALREDLALWRSTGLYSLPAYLVQYDGRSELLQSFDYGDFVSAITHISRGSVRPKAVRADSEALCELLRSHPLISALEIREALDLKSVEDAEALVNAVKKYPGIQIRKINHGPFFEVL